MQGNIMQNFLPIIDKYFLIKKPLKYQLLKWIGSKHRFAEEIISYFPIEFNTYFEPFLGSGAILGTLSPKKGIASDIFPPLLEIWETLKNNPNLLKEWYDSRWEKLNSGDKKKEYEKIKASYNNKQNGADLLFLSRSCYGGVVRFRKIDGFMSTPCGIHNPIPPYSFNKRVDEWHERVKNTDFFLLDYKEIMKNAKANDLIYCDPPYSYSQGILYGAQEFKLEELFDMIKDCKEKGVYVALSIDGIKKSGNYKCDLPIPDGLFKREIFITCGRSMLKRFQMKGESLEKEIVEDRLLLTY